MSTAISATTMKPTQNFQDILGSSYSRRLLLNALDQSPTPAPSSYVVGDNNFDANVVMVLSVLLCALVCSLGLNSIIRCALRCSSLVPSEVSDDHAVRLTNSGVNRKALKSFQTVTYSTELNLPGLDTECAICLSEFVSEEHVKLLPKCHHGFHVRCIDKWLSSHSSCPTCRHCLIETCKKIADGSQTSSLNSTQPPEDSISVQIAPLGPERWISR